MRIIYNSHIPFGPFWATNILGIVFCRKDKGKLPPAIINHEYIHTLQQREMGYLPFLIWYPIEWLIRYIRCRDSMKAYRSILFEREAYDNQHNLQYPLQRKHYAWWHLRQKKSKKK